MLSSQEWRSSIHAGLFPKNCIAGSLCKIDVWSFWIPSESVLGKPSASFCSLRAMEELRIVLTGASGLLGRELLGELRRVPGCRVQGWAFTRAAAGLQKVDLTDSRAVEAAFNAFQPDMVVHSAAERNPDGIAKDMERSVKLNLETTEHLAKLLRARDSRKKLMLFISTDYVFDGENPPYSEFSPPNPINQYGQMKLEGEMLIRQTLNESEWAILRVPLLYGEVERLGEGAVDQVLKSMVSCSGPVRIDHVQRRFPTRTVDVAHTIRFLLDKHIQNPGSINGIFHWSGSEAMTKYDMAMVLKQTYQLVVEGLEPGTGVAPCPDPKVRRPRDASLSCGRLLALGLPPPSTSFADSVKDLYRQFLEV